MTLLLPEADIVPLASSTPRLEWSANHAGGWHPVTAGWGQVWMLVNAINGDDWPWTGITLPDRSRWFQVLGTSECCLLEVSSEHGVYTVHGDDARPQGWVALPAECAWWVGAIRSDEALTTSEAYVIGMRWLMGREPSWGLRPIHDSAHRN